MHCPLRNLDAAEMGAGKIAQEFVMIAGDIDDAGPLARLAQHFLDHVIAILRPIPAALQPPAVNDIADEVDCIGLVVAQEIQQKIGLGGLGAEMHIGNEQRTEASSVHCFHHEPGVRSLSIVSPSKIRLVFQDDDKWLSKVVCTRNAAANAWISRPSEKLSAATIPYCAL
jgi:hypothetical protein